MWPRPRLSKRATALALNTTQWGYVLAGYTLWDGGRALWGEALAPLALPARGRRPGGAGLGGALPAGDGRAGAVHLPRPAPVPRVAAGLAGRDGAPALRVAAGGRRPGRRPPRRRRRRTNVSTLDALKRTARRWRTRATRWVGSWTDGPWKTVDAPLAPARAAHPAGDLPRGRAPTGRPPAGGGRGRRAAGHLRGAGRPAVRRGRRRRPRASCRRWAAVLNALKGGGVQFVARSRDGALRAAVAQRRADAEGNALVPYREMGLASARHLEALMQHGDARALEFFLVVPGKREAELDADVATYAHLFGQIGLHLRRLEEPELSLRLASVTRPDVPTALVLPPRRGGRLQREPPRAGGHRRGAFVAPQGPPPHRHRVGHPAPAGPPRRAAATLASEGPRRREATRGDRGDDRCRVPALAGDAPPGAGRPRVGHPHPRPVHRPGGPHPQPPDRRRPARPDARLARRLPAGRRRRDPLPARRPRWRRARPTGRCGCGARSTSPTSSSASVGAGGRPRRSSWPCSRRR